LDAAAIGNHEFDWSVDTLRARMKDAHYPFVSANITDSTGTARPEWAEPWTLVQRNGNKVAGIGLTTTSTRTTTAPRNVSGLAFGDGAIAIKRELRFFFQAEDGIRVDLVTGVQTCALPIFGATLRRHQTRAGL